MRTAFTYLILSGLVGAWPVAAQTDAKKVVPPHLLTELLALNGDIETRAKPKYLSPAEIVASPDKQKIYVVEQTAKCIARVDIASKAVDKIMPMPNEPTGIAISKDGATLYVTCASNRWSRGYVCVVDVASGRVTARIAVGCFARSPVLSPSGTILYTCNWFSNDVSVVDLAAKREVARIPVTREPYAAAITPDGATLVVTNSLPDQKATDTVELACKVALVNTATKTVRAQVPLPVGSHSLFGVCVTPDGSYALATHLIGRFTLPAVTLEGGWVHTNNLAIVDIAGGRLLNDVELDTRSRGYPNPWGLGCTPDGKIVCVAFMGSTELGLIKLPELLTMAKAGKDLSHDFTSIYSIKKIVRLQSKSPRALAMVDTVAYVAGYFSDNIDVVAVSGLSNPALSSIALGPEKPVNSERKGEIIFYDAALCYQGWQCCHSCHPFTRPDALNWMLASEMTKQRNAKSMLYSWWTPPTAWNGRRPHAGGPDGSIRMGIYYELMTTPTEAVGGPLDTFFMGLRPVMSPRLAKGRLSEAAQKGKLVYDKIGCSSCHPAPLYTNNKVHNAGVPDPQDPGMDWNTPSLIEAWRTAPYGHLGSFDKIKEIIQLRAHSLGATQLSDKDMNDLIEYVQSL